MVRQKFFKQGNIKPLYGKIADYVKQEKEEKAQEFLTICPKCGAIEKKKRWFWDPEVKESKRKEVTYRLCPGDEAIENQWIEGDILLKNKIVTLVPEQIESLMRNIEEAERHVDPRNRIALIKKNKSFWKVYTTSVYLAERIGRELEKTYVSHVTYKFSKGEKRISVVWEEKA